MALQVRLRHALGERVLELPERGVAEPLVIGRANEADIQIPSVGVSPRHCVLFVHEGQWVIQGTAGVTKLNGRLLSGPAALSIGDRITVGNDASPPSLEIDPLSAAEGGSGPARAILAQAGMPSTAPANRGTAAALPPSPAPHPTAPPPPRYAPPPPQMQGFQSPQGQEEATSDQIDWTTQAASSRAPTIGYHIPKRRKTSGAGTAVAILFGVLVLGGAALYAYRRTRQIVPTPVVITQTQPAVPAPDEDTPTFHSKLFDVAGNAQKSSTATGSEPPTQPAPDSSDAPEPKRPARADATWEDVVARHYEVERQGAAIIAFDEYRRLHPGDFDKELDRYTDDAVNWIWWQRVNQLWNQRDRLAEAVRKKKQDVRAQPAGSFHDRLVSEQADLEAQYAKVQQSLTVEMGYTRDAPPDVKNPAALRELSKTRDPAKYADFKKRILNYVRIHHGDLPWAGDE